MPGKAGIQLLFSYHCRLPSVMAYFLEHQVSSRLSIRENKRKFSLCQPDLPNEVPRGQNWFSNDSQHSIKSGNSIFQYRPCKQRNVMDLIHLYFFNWPIFWRVMIFSFGLSSRDPNIFAYVRHRVSSQVKSLDMSIDAKRCLTYRL